MMAQPSASPDGMEPQLKASRQQQTHSNPEKFVRPWLHKSDKVGNTSTASDEVNLSTDSPSNINMASTPNHSQRDSLHSGYHTLASTPYGCAPPHLFESSILGFPSPHHLSNWPKISSPSASGPTFNAEQFFRGRTTAKELFVNNSRKQDSGYSSFVSTSADSSNTTEEMRASTTQADNKENLQPPKNTKRTLPKKAIAILEAWYKHNYNYPYPDAETAGRLAKEGSISTVQVSKWMANKRSRTYNTLTHSKCIHPKKMRSLQKKIKESGRTTSSAPYPQLASQSGTANSNSTSFTRDGRTQLQNSTAGHFNTPPAFPSSVNALPTYLHSATFPPLYLTHSSLGFPPIGYSAPTYLPSVPLQGMSPFVPPVLYPGGYRQQWSSP